jgi:hypothetical protein
MSNKLKYNDIKAFGQIEAEGITITGQYSLPSLDGTINQILSTDGSGNLQFIDISSLSVLLTGGILNGIGLNWTIIGLNSIQGDVTLSPFSTTDLSEGINLYFTDERVDDRVNLLLQNGTTGTNPTSSIIWTYSDISNTLTPAVSLGPFTTDALSQGTTNLYFSNELVDDRVAVLLQSGITGTDPTSPIIWNYVDGLDQLIPEISLGPFDTDALSEGVTNLYFTDQRAEDAIAPLLTNTSSVTWTYDPFAHTIEANAIVGITGMEVKLDGGVVGTQPTIEFLTGASILINATNDAFNNKVTVEINAVLSATLEELTDVFFNSPGEQANDILIYNGAAWTSVSPSEYADIISPNIESITYANLVIKKAASELKPGRLYEISDYETIYEMPGTSPVVNITAAVEVITLTAISINELSPIAFSKTNPSDIIHYDLEPTLGVRNTVAGSKGAILFREDTSTGNSYPADFRAVVCRRWDDGGGVFDVLIENANPSTDYPIFGTGCTNNTFEILNGTVLLGYGVTDDLPNIFLPANSSNNVFSEVSYGNTFQAASSSNEFFGVTIFNSFRSFSTFLINKGILVDNVFSSGVADLFITHDGLGTGITNTSFAATVRSCEFSNIDTCTFSNSVSNVKIKFITNSTFSNALSRVEVVSITNSIFSSTVGDLYGKSISTCNFTGAISNLTFNELALCDFADITNCSFKYYINTSAKAIGSGFSGNVFLGKIVETSFGDAVTSNTFSSDVIDSTFGNSISSCSFGNYVDTVTVSQTLTDVVFSGVFSNSSLTAPLALSNVSFITKVDSITIAVGSADLANTAIHSEVVYDSGSAGWFETFLNGGTYSYTLIA